MSKQKTLNELDELLNIQQFERILFHKITELKLYLKDEIDYYRELKGHFRKLAYGDMEVLSQDEDEDEDEESAERDWSADSNERRQIYHFELSQDDNNQWHVAGLEPSPPVGYSFCDIIPEEIIQYIVSVAIPSGKIEEIKDLSLPDLEGMRFDLHFTRYSPYHILGTIKTHQLEEVEEGENSEEICEEIYDFTRKQPEESDYKELLYYMHKYPQLRMYFFTEFYMRMKPLIHGKMIDISASSRPADRF